MRNQGLAHMGIGRAKGENRVIESVRQAVSSPLLETTIEGAKSVILNVTGGKDLMLSEISEAAELVQGIIDPAANIIFGNTIDDTMVDEVKITVIATGFNPASQEKKTLTSIKEEPKENLPPLLREIEEKEQNSKAQETAQATVNEQEAEVETEDENPTEIAMEAEPEEEPAEKKRELPAFMRKLFGKK